MHIRSHLSALNHSIARMTRIYSRRGRRRGSLDRRISQYSVYRDGPGRLALCVYLRLQVGVELVNCQCISARL